MKNIIALFLVAFFVSAKAQRLPCDFFSAEYQYSCTYDKNGRNIGKTACFTNILSIIVLADNYSKPRGYLTYSWMSTNGPVSQTLNYFGGYDKIGYHFADATEFYNPVIGQSYPRYHSAIHISISSDFSKLRYSIDGSFFYEFIKR